MTTQETKVWLMRGRKIEGRIEQLEEAGRRAWDMETRVTSNPGRERMQTSGERRKGENFAILSDEIGRELVRLNYVKVEILRVISQIENNILAQLLTAYYVNGHTWEQTAAVIHYSYYRTVHDKHPQALEAVKAILKRCDKM